MIRALTLTLTIALAATAYANSSFDLPTGTLPVYEWGEPSVPPSSDDPIIVPVANNETVIPEPTTGLLFGIAGLALLRRTRR
jgi:hypothetical protein